MGRQLGEEYIALEARREDRLQKNEEICSVHWHIERSRKTESENVPRYDKLEVAGDLKWMQLAAGAEIISHIIEQMDKALSQCHKGQTPGSWSQDIGFRKKKKPRQNSLPCYNNDQQKYSIAYIFAHNAMLNRVEGEVSMV